MLKKHSIIMLPTDNPSFPCLCIGTPALGLRWTSHKFGYEGTKYFQLYILSDEEIKVKDWIVSDKSIAPIYVDGVINTVEMLLPNHWKKVVAAKDKSLTYTISVDCGSSVGNTLHTKIIPQIPESFVHLYIAESNKGNIIKSVNVEYEEIDIWDEDWDDNIGAVPYVKEKKERLKVCSDNTVIVHPIRNSFTREEVRRVAIDFHKFRWDDKHNTTESEFDEWFKNY